MFIWYCQKCHIIINSTKYNHSMWRKTTFLNVMNYNYNKFIENVFNDSYNYITKLLVLKSINNRLLFKNSPLVSSQINRREVLLWKKRAFMGSNLIAPIGLFIRIFKWFYSNPGFKFHKYGFPSHKYTFP